MPTFLGLSESVVLGIISRYLCWQSQRKYKRLVKVHVRMYKFQEISQEQAIELRKAAMESG